jgi:hypothetical protein
MTNLYIADDFNDIDDGDQAVNIDLVFVLERLLSVEILTIFPPGLEPPAEAVYDFPPL